MGQSLHEGGYSAIVDCLCLSMCNYILGSTTSVFSRFAAEYGEIRLYECSIDDIGEWKDVTEWKVAEQA